LSPAQILLVFKAAIHGEQHIEFGGFCGSQEIAVLESSETSVSSGLALRDRASDFADAGKPIRQEGSSSKLADKCGLGVLKRGNGVLAADRGKILEEFVQSVSCFEVVARKRLRGTSLSSSIRTSPSLTRMALSI
jgi:hypothetical protein